MTLNSAYACMYSFIGKVCFPQAMKRAQDSPEETSNTRQFHEDDGSLSEERKTQLEQHKAGKSYYN